MVIFCNAAQTQRANVDIFFSHRAAYAGKHAWLIYILIHHDISFQKDFDSKAVNFNNAVVLLSKYGSSNLLIRPFGIKTYSDKVVIGFTLIRFYLLNLETAFFGKMTGRSEEHTSELQSRFDLVCRLLLEKK